MRRAARYPWQIISEDTSCGLKMPMVMQSFALVPKTDYVDRGERVGAVAAWQ